MTPDDTLERHLANGLAGMAGSGAPDYLDDVLRRSSRTRQRRAWLLQRSVFPARGPHERAGWTTRRSVSIIPMLKVAAVAILAVAVGVVIDPLRPSSPFGAADPSPSASPSAAPLNGATSPLVPGTYYGALWGAGRWTVTVPAGWGESEGILWSERGAYSTREDIGGPGEVGMGWELVANVFTDPCHWMDSLADPPVGPSADDLATAFTAGVGRDVSGPTDLMFGGYPAKRVELSMPADLDEATCDEGYYRDFLVRGEALDICCELGRPELGRLFTVLYILDIEGTRYVMRTWHRQSSSEEDLAELAAMLGSIRIDPPAPAADKLASPGPVTWSPASLEQDWPAPVRAEPAGDPVVVPWTADYTDARGDIESSDVPWIDILTVTQPSVHVHVGVGALAPSPLAGSNEPWIAYGLVLDTDRDGVADVRFGMDLVPAELTPWRSGPEAMDVRTWRTDLETGTTEFGNSDSSVCSCLYPHPGIPGAAAFIALGKEGRSLGRFYAWASVIQDGRVVATDYAPDRGWLERAEPLPPSDPSAGPTTR